MPGYLYVLSNPAMPGLLKIGHSNATPDARMRQLASTGVPAAFVLECCFYLRNPSQVEQSVHRALTASRESKDREFFRATVAAFLEVALPMIIEDLGSPQPTSATASAARHTLSELEVLLLQIIVNRGEGGANKYVFTWERPRVEKDDLSVTVALANLHESKLVKKLRSPNEYDPFWSATPRGIKLLADNSLLAEWMR